MALLRADHAALVAESILVEEERARIKALAAKWKQKVEDMQKVLIQWRQIKAMRRYPDGPDRDQGPNQGCASG